MSAHAQWEGKMLQGVWKKSVNLEIEKHGEEGWELVAVLPGKEDRRELYFKRPKREPKPEAEAAGEADAKPTGKGKATYKFADDIRSAFRDGLEGKD